MTTYGLKKVFLVLRAYYLSHATRQYSSDKRLHNHGMGRQPMLSVSGKIVKIAHRVVAGFACSAENAYFCGVKTYALQLWQRVTDKPSGCPSST